MLVERTGHHYGGLGKESLNLAAVAGHPDPESGAQLVENADTVSRSLTTPGHSWRRRPERGGRTICTRAS